MEDFPQATAPAAPAGQFTATELSYDLQKICLHGLGKKYFLFLAGVLF
jgi:hypothetical protein